MTNMVILIQEATSHSKKIKHRWESMFLKLKKKIMLWKVKLESHLHERIPQVENNPKD